MNTGAESANFNHLIPKPSKDRDRDKFVYANTVNASANQVDSNYQKNNTKLRKPRGGIIILRSVKLPFSRP